MEPLGYHLVFRAIDSRVLAPGVASQRLFAAIAHRVGEPRGLLAFRASGDHAHLTAACDRAAAGALAQALGSAWTQQLALPGFGPVHLEPLVDQRHVENAFLYVLRNTEKHGAAHDPAHEASSIGGLLGLRLVPEGFLPRVRRHLPRLDRETLLGVLGVASLAPGFQLDLLADAAAGAIGLAELDRSELSDRARAAAARVAAPHAQPAAVAAALGIAPRTERRYRAAAPEGPLERAIGLRMGFLLALGERARLDRPLLDAPRRARPASRPPDWGGRGLAGHP